MAGESLGDEVDDLVGSRFRSGLRREGESRVAQREEILLEEVASAEIVDLEPVGSREVVDTHPPPERRNRER
jgi:hypothetical protein